MGSPAQAYKDFVIEYIRLSAFGTKYKRIVKDGTAYDMSIDELEKIAKSFNPNNPFYKAYLGGVAIANCLEEFCNDEVNAACCMIEPFEELIGVKSVRISEVKELVEDTDEVVLDWTKEKVDILENLIQQSIILVQQHTSEKDDKNQNEKDIIDLLDRAHTSLIRLKEANNLIEEDE